MVAALTIPTLVSNYQKQSYVTALKRAQAEITQANKLIMVDENVESMLKTSLFNFEGADTSDEVFISIKNAYSKYLKISKFCIGDDCSDKIYNSLSGDEEGGALWNLMYAMTLNNGIMFMAYITAGNDEICEEYKLSYGARVCEPSFFYYIDINGETAPNVFGRDLFVFVADSSGMLYPAGSKIASILEPQFGEYWRDNPDDCNPQSSAAAGISCAGRVLEEGKMNY